MNRRWILVLLFVLLGLGWTVTNSRQEELVVLATGGDSTWLVRSLIEEQAHKVGLKVQTATLLGCCGEFPWDLYKDEIDFAIVSVDELPYLESLGFALIAPYLRNGEVILSRPVPNPRLGLSPVHEAHRQLLDLVWGGEGLQADLPSTFLAYAFYQQEVDWVVVDFLHAFDWEVPRQPVHEIIGEYLTSALVASPRGMRYAHRFKEVYDQAVGTLNTPEGLVRAVEEYSPQLLAELIASWAQTQGVWFGGEFD